MRYSLYFAWALVVLMIGFLTTLASFPKHIDGPSMTESRVVLGAHGSRAIKLQHVRCNPLKPSCRAAAPATSTSTRG